MGDRSPGGGPGDWADSGGRAIAVRPTSHAADDVGYGARIPAGWPRLAARWQILADHLGLPFCATLPPANHGEPQGTSLPLERLRQRRAAWFTDEDGIRRLAVAPIGGEVDALATLLRRHPAEARRLVIAPPEAIRSALVACALPQASLDAVVGVIRRDPSLSALGVPTRGQVGWIVALGVSLAWALAAVPAATLAALAVLSAALFLPVASLRALAATETVPVPPIAPLPPDDPDLPSYAVLVPLYREAAVLPGLVAALRRLSYPRDRLTMLLVVEADDTETREAAVAATRGTGIEVLAVPPGVPRTKPKALDAALAFIDSDIVTLFDAEDRPAPDQLLVAAAAFRDGPEELAAVQAELAIDNAGASNTWIARLFAIEYAMLFRGLLPWLAGRGLLLPLGGTSNHFRREALVAVGAWDPHNVTEDADLAVRLVRAGWRLGVIPSRTDEEAPTAVRPWIKQRSRWLKGWMQTWLVHMREPRRTLAELGPANFIIFQALVGGQIAAALAYPLSLVLGLLVLVGGGFVVDDRSLAAETIRMGCLVALASGFGGAFGLALRVLRGGRQRLSDLVLLPVYWLLLSIAALRAVVDLARDPYHWEKTTHGLATRAPTAMHPPHGEQG